MNAVKEISMIQPVNQGFPDNTELFSALEYYLRSNKFYKTALLSFYSFQFIKDFINMNTTTTTNTTVK